ncbi:MAG: alcohol dehydrogenase catalytic domain-containing protein [Pseudomonadota bacterium]
MKALVFKGVNEIGIEEVPKPRIEDDEDVIVRCLATTICGTDIHLINGKTPGMRPGQILGHEMVGIVEEVGDRVSRLAPGDRVVIPSTIACGRCGMCRQGSFSHCLTVLRGKTAFFGGPEDAGHFPGLQAEYARVPFADVGALKVPGDLSNEAALCLSDIFPTAYFAVDNAQVTDGESVAVFGCGPVGLYAVLSAATQGANPIFAVDREAARLEIARRFPSTRAIDFSREDPVEVIRGETGMGADVVLDCVGIDASDPSGRPAPGQAQAFALQCVRATGVMSIVGLYPSPLANYPLGQVVDKNLSVVAGNCNHRAYLAELLDYLRTHPADGEFVWTHRMPFERIGQAYDFFINKREGMIKPFITMH